MNFDVAIVGAGPGGTAAALALARHDLRVALIEKAVPPRYKTCGGGILSRVGRLLQLDFAAVVERQCFEVELLHHKPDLRLTVRRDQPIISMVMRDRFDHLLTDEAQRRGTKLLAGTSVLKVTPSSNDIELVTTAGPLRARFVIAADGVGSAVARLTGAPELRRVIPAVECEVTPDAAVLEKLSRSARFDLGFVPFGYAWVFPKREHLSIGVLTTHRGGANLNQYYERYLDLLGIQQPLREERHGFMIPIRPRESALGIPRVLFVGDAAGLADPILAEGITAAILSGQLAAEAIVQSNFDDAAVKEAYWKTLSGQLLAELRVARCLARVLYDWPRVRTALLARHGAALSELVANVVMGATTYSAAVRRPGNYFKLLWNR